MTTSSVTDYGVLLKIGDGGGTEVFTVIGEVVNLDPPELNQEVVEATNHSSGGWREFVSGGLKELTEFKCKINYVPANTDALIAKVLAGTKHNFQIIFPNTDIWAFGAIIKSFKASSSDAKSPDVSTAEIIFRPSGTSTVT